MPFTDLSLETYCLNAKILKNCLIFNQSQSLIHLKARFLFLLDNLQIFTEKVKINKNQNN
jgi:hypothetical protein